MSTIITHLSANKGQGALRHISYYMIYGNDLPTADYKNHGVKMDETQIYLAPMEGITGYTYRNVHAKHFTGADRCFTPFISTHKKLGNKVIKEINPDNNKGIELIPQIMIGNVNEVEELCLQIMEYGYKELNLNAGCPSGTVVGKNRGSGLLRNPDALDEMLEGVFDVLAKYNCRLSIKTRLGWSNVDEWETLSKIYGRYPFSEVIVHARVREEFYNGRAHREQLGVTIDNIPVPICYNGDIFSPKDVWEIHSEYPEINRFMIGRGMLVYPELVELIKNVKPDTVSGESDINLRIYEYIDDLYNTYFEMFGSEINTLYHMKELWSHLGKRYPEYEKELKTIRKTKNVAEYKAAVRAITMRKEGI